MVVCAWMGGCLVVGQPALCFPSPRQEGESAGDKRTLPEAPDKDKGTAAPKGDEVPTPDGSQSLKTLGADFVTDQKQIWTSPLRLRFSDTEWLVPLAGISAGLFVTDRDVSLHLSHDPKTISHYTTLSNAGVGAMVGGQPAYGC